MRERPRAAKVDSRRRELALQAGDKGRFLVKHGRIGHIAGREQTPVTAAPGMIFREPCMSDRTPLQET
jgi:hypothetical protein